MTNTVRCTSSVAVPSAAGTDPGAPSVWVQVAQEIDARGYGGGPFKFTPETFGQIVRNFRSHPAYDGGTADVVPWDFHHASEADPASGDIATTGAPAQGWVQELDVRPGPRGFELWAKTRWLEPARTYVKNGQYKWASVVVLFDARDPVSGANVGAVLSSVALTNEPFIEGMAPLVAASRHAPMPAQRVAASRVVVVGRDISKSSPVVRALQAVQARRSTQQSDERDTSLPAKIDATAAAGRNATERAITAMRQHNAGFARLSWDEQVSRAAEAIKLGVVRA